MKTKNTLCFFVAVLIALYAIGLVAATGLNVNITDVEVDGTSVSDGTIAVAPGETVSVKVTFQSEGNDTITDAKLKVYIDGYKSDVYASTSRFNILPGKKYTKTLSIKLPSSVDMDDIDETLDLIVRIADKSDDVESQSQITLQKDSYQFNVLSVDAPLEASAGDIIALDVVLTNEGTDTLENSFVTAVISELGVQKKAYFGDIYPVDNEDTTQSDARERRIYLTIPSNAVTGIYQIEVSASNYDASQIVKKNIAITGLAVENSDTTVIKTDNENVNGIPNSIIILTIVLVVIFVVLLVVLIILLTRKPSEKTNDFGETSYY